MPPSAPPTGELRLAHFPMLQCIACDCGMMWIEIDNEYARCICEKCRQIFKVIPEQKSFPPPVPQEPEREFISLTTKQANDLIVAWRLLQKVATVESHGEGKLIVEHASMRVYGQQALAYIEPIIAKIQHISNEIEGGK